MHRRRNIREHILHALSGSRQASERVGCEGEGEKFLMGIMTACHADPGLHPCVRAGWRCLIELSLHLQRSPRSKEWGHPRCIHPHPTHRERYEGVHTGSVWSVRLLPQSAGACQRLRETARDCQRVAGTCQNASKHRDTHHISANSHPLCFHCFVTHATQPQPQPNHRPTTNRSSKFSFVRLRKRLLSRISPVAYSWSRVALRILSLLTVTGPFPA
jgi:hypothetical protein